MADVYTLQSTIESLESQKQVIDGYIEQYRQRKTYIENQIDQTRQELEEIRVTAEQAISQAQ